MFFIQNGAANRDLVCYCGNKVTVKVEVLNEECQLANFTNRTGISTNHRVLGCTKDNHRHATNGIQGISGNSVSVCLANKLSVKIYANMPFLTVYWTCVKCRDRNCLVCLRNDISVLTDGKYVFREYYLDTDNNRFVCNCGKTKQVNRCNSEETNVPGLGNIRFLERDLGAILVYLPSETDYRLIKWICHGCNEPCVLFVHAIRVDERIDVRLEPSHSVDLFMQN